MKHLIPHLERRHPVPRHFVVLFLMLLLAAIPVQAQQWEFFCVDNWDVDIIGSDTVVVVGDYGKILRSTDGGTTWQRQQSDTYERLAAVHFFDPLDGIILGDNGMLLTTTNGGNQWQQDNTGISVPITNLNAASASILFATGSNGLIMKSTDKGRNWEQFSSGSLKSLLDIHFLNETTGFAVGREGTLLKTTDGGETWSSMEAGTTEDLYTLDFIDSIGLIGGAHGTLLMTTDGGDSWETQWAFANTTLSYDVLCLSGERYLSVGSGPEDIALTTDGGKSWRPILIGSSKSQFFPFRSIAAADSAHITIVGMENSIFRSTDGGSSWGTISLTTQRAPTGGTLVASAFAAPGLDTMLLVGSSPWGQAIYLRSTDGGTTWKQGRITASSWLSTVHFTSSTDGLAATANGATMLRTSNAGLNWDLFHPDWSPPAQSLQDMAFVDPATGWIVGRTAVYRVQESAGEWVGTPVDDVSFLGYIEFVDHDHGFLSGFKYVPPDTLSSMKVFRTDDGGGEWTRIFERYGYRAQSMQFLDARTGFLPSINDYTADGRGIVYRTTDGGETWDSTRFPRLIFDVRVFDNGYGLAVGSGFSLFVTTDRGETWQAEDIVPTPYRDTTITLSRIFLHRDQRTLILHGSRGILLRKTYPEALTSVPVGNPAAAHADPLEIHIAPNPSSGTIRTLRIAGLVPGTDPELQLIDLLGREVSIRIIGRNAGNHTFEATMHLEGITPGTYLLVVDTGDGTAVQRLVVL